MPRNCRAKFALSMTNPNKPANLELASAGLAGPGTAQILVVDDNVDAAELMAEWLRVCGFSVDVAHDGHSALSLIDQHAPRVMFIDLGLPDLDGVELARRVRARPDATGSCLIALTGYGRASDRKRTAEAGFDLHLTKPVELDDLQSVLALLLPS